MLRLTFLVPALIWSAVALAQQPPAPPPPPAVDSSPPVSACRVTDALCIISERLKNKDFGIGSRSGMTPGLVAKEPPGLVIPGGRVDEQFIKEFKT